MNEDALARLAVQYMLGTVFLVSAAPKLLSPARVGRDIQNYKILPQRLSRSMGWLLPPVELFAALSLLGNLAPQAGALIAATLLTLFMLAVALAMLRKQNIACTCFGLLYRERVGWSTQARDMILLTMAGFVFLVAPKPELLWVSSTSNTVGGILVQAVFVLAALSLAWIAAKGWPRWFVRLIRRRNAPSGAVTVR